MTPRRTKTPSPRFSGDLQAEVMEVIWRLGEASVDEVRAQQPARARSAYTTVQTVMNRLVERGLLTRKREGHAFRYRAKIDESTYVLRAIKERLSEASPPARKAALVNLVEELTAEDRAEIAEHAETIRKKREAG